MDIWDKIAEAAPKILETVSKTQRNAAAVQNTANQKKASISSFLKRNENKFAYIYVGVVAFIFVFMCIIMGHPSWIVTVFTESTVGDYINEIPQLVLDYFDYSMNNMATSDVEVVREKLDVIAYAIAANIPMVVQFGFIDNFVTTYIKADNRKQKGCIFIAQCFIQALIALSWTEPVDFAAFSQGSGPIICILISMWVVSFLVPILKTIFTKTIYTGEGFDLNIDKNLSVPFSVVIGFFQEFIKAIISFSIFTTAISMVYITTIFTKQELIVKFLNIIAPILYIFCYRALSKPINYITSFLIYIFLKKEKINYQKTAFSDVFGCIFAVGMMVTCFVMYFKLR